jgi:rare lipoprotein A (peptidoglycan hydrolase)
MGRARLTWLVLLYVALPTIRCAARVSPTGRITDSESVLESREGLASYYGRAFDGKVTARDVRFDGRFDGRL